MLGSPNEEEDEATASSSAYKGIKKSNTKDDSSSYEPPSYSKSEPAKGDAKNLVKLKSEINNLENKLERIGKEKDFYQVEYQEVLSKYNAVMKRKIVEKVFK